MTTTQRPQQIEALPLTEPQIPGSYLEVINSADPSAAFQEIAGNPELVDGFLHSAEDDLGEAGAELELRIHTRKEKTRFSDALEGYETFLGLVATDKADKLIAGGTSEGKVKHEVIKTIMDSNTRVLEKDITFRLGDSLYERVKEKLAQSKVARMAGRIALGGAEVTTAYLAWKGLFGEDIDTISKGERLVLFAAVTGRYGTRLGGERFRRKVMASIDKYTPSIHHKKSKDATEPKSKAIETTAYSDLLDAMNEDLYHVAGRTFMEDGTDAKSLVGILVGEVDKLYRQFYESHNKKHWMGKGALKSAAAAITDGLFDLDLGDEGIADDLTDSLREAVKRVED